MLKLGGIFYVFCREEKEEERTIFTDAAYR